MVNTPYKTFFNWSTGKDAALALYHLQLDERYKVERLVTTVNTYYNRISMHGLRLELLHQQARATGIPLTVIELPREPSMQDYQVIMQKHMERLIKEGFTTSAFGDIYLEDLRAFRENQLQQMGLKACFPLWRRNTRDLVRELVDLGFRAVIVAIDAGRLDPSFAGREIDSDLLRDLPPDVDACGENGEFHAFCYDGPVFSHPVPFTLGEQTYREYPAPGQEKDKVQKARMGFWFRDLIPTGQYPQ